jgi:endoglucanase
MLMGAVAASLCLATPGRVAAQVPAPGPAGAEMREVINLALGSMWRLYVERFITPNGRVVDNGNGNISHSEGQGYALVLAARANDRATFDRVLAWTERELYGSREFAAWKWEPDAMPHITDPNNATDGDILIAWGLLLGHRAFGEQAFLDTALERIRAIHDQLVIDTPFGPALTPGLAGFSADDFDDGPVLNPSYWVFPALDDFAVVTPDIDWKAVKQSGYKLIEASRFGPLQLPTEWVGIGGPTPAPAAEFAPEFSYNAIRIPLYLALDPDAPRELLGPFVGMWNPVEDVGPFTIDVVSGEARDTLDGQGYKAIFALTDCIQGFRQVQSLFQGDEYYYPATLGLFAIHRLSEEYSTCL